MMPQRSKVTERLVICIRSPLSQRFGDREVVNGIVGLNPAKDHSIACYEFKGDMIARFEAQAFADLFRDSHLTSG